MGRGEISVVPLSCWAKRRRKIMIFALAFPRQFPRGRLHHSLSSDVPLGCGVVARSCYFDFPSSQQWGGKRDEDRVPPKKKAGFPSRDVLSLELRLGKGVFG